MLGGQTLNGRTDDAILHLLHPLLRGEGNGGDGTHAACVQACVVLSDTLVVLGLRENLVVLPIRQDEDTALNTTEEFFYHHLRGGVAEHTTQHLLQLLLGLVEGGEDEHALTSTESVGFQHVRGYEGL